MRAFIPTVTEDLLLHAVILLHGLRFPAGVLRWVKPHGSLKRTRGFRSLRGIRGKTHLRTPADYRRPCRRMTACRRRSSVTVRGVGSHGRRLTTERWSSTALTQQCFSKMPMNASPFPIIGIFQDRCWAVKLSMIWQLLWQPREEHIDQLLSAKRDSPGSVPLPHRY